MNLNKKLIFESYNALISIIPEYSLLLIEFKPVDFLDEEEYKEGAKFVLDFVRQEKIKKMLFNTHNLNTVLPVSLQKWVAENVNRELLQLLDKIAIVEPQNPITHLSLQQYVEESLKYGSRAKESIFQDEDEALKWLIKEV